MVASVGAYWCLHVLPLTTSKNFDWANFRNYFSYDQYSYLAIAVNVSNGNLDNVEPFTETGASHYPRLYYVLLGLIARAFSADVIATWQVVGIAFQLAMVLAVGWLFIRLTNRAAFGLLGFVPSLIGVLAVPISGSWLHTLNNHGVLWGTFGTMFTLNGEAAGIAIAIMAACLLVGFTFPRRGPGRDASKLTKAAIVFAACVGIGMLANVQTYSFITAVYFLSYIAASFGLMKFGNRRHFIFSGASLLAVLLGGTFISGAAGPLAALVAGLAGAVPGALLLMRSYPAMVWASVVGVAGAAAPTIIGTLSGMAQHDEFLAYRALSSEDLGVPFPLGLVGAAVPALFLGTIFWAGIKRGNKAWLSLSLGIAVAWPLVATNDIWGANQEPYRFWIDSFILATAVSMPVLAQVLVDIADRARSARILEAANTAADKPSSTQVAASGRKPRQDIKLTRTVLLTTAAGIVIWGALAVSVLDYVGFAFYVHNQGTAPFDDAQARAISKTADSLPDGAAGIVLPDPCIDPFRLKALTGVPTAFYNLGLAWPPDEPSFRGLLEEREAETLDQRLAERAGVEYVMIDSGCQANWQEQVTGSKVAETAYDTGASTAAVTLWKIGP